MEEEFEAELTRLSHKLTNESETAQFWQQKHSASNQNYLKSDTELRLLRQELGGLNQVKEDRDRDIKTRISSLMLDRDAFREAYNEAMGELRGKDERLRELQGQVRGLKSWVSREGKAVGGEQVSDEIVGEKVRGLGNGLQNWVITNFRRVKINLEKMDDDTKDQLLRLVPTYDILASSSKVHFIQSLVSRILVEHIFSAYFVGLPQEQAYELTRMEKYLSDFGRNPTMNQWRSATLSIIQKEAPKKLKSETAAVVEVVMNQVNTIMDSIGDLQHTESRDQSLRSLVNNSIELARLVRVQKADFSIMMPCIEGHQRTMFDPDTMEDIGGEDEDTLNEREIRCVTFPGVVKAGDENGERSHLRNVVAKIRVLCSPD
ncbi:uncharacterized protein LY89DRAFT_583613 [Mollisia scopiformis]|uniref:Uncharacterized protein n=1 Tax=Mollisia scopiformis TaxID=149040 RepID=A0A194XDN2_MOLSC|nr:uncharacterized protein LY89DRAFT_583613 [Mollisia scopiformis]KUJ18283.1 hypothetical protein LY89DRAFT_583613 [Mollisia scopiformis]